VTPTLRKPKGKSSYTLAEGQEPPLDKTRQPGVDQEARWVKKGGKLQYGYKRHYLAEAQKGLVLAVHTTPANVHDSQLETLARCGLNVGDFGYIMVNQIFIHQPMIS
jgi:IS5 family transposase